MHTFKKKRFCHHYLNRILHKSDKDVRRQLESIEGDINTIFDIGACIGSFSISYAGRINNNDLKIYAFEPIRSSYDVLVKNIEINNLCKIIEPFNLGLDSKEGRVVMGIPADRLDEKNNGLYTIQSGGEKLGREVLCEMIRLSDFIKNNNIREIDIIKIDAEGKDLDILGDILEMLPNVRYIHIEVNKEFKSSKKICTFLKKHGFEYIKNTHSINEFWRNNNYGK